MADQIPNMPNKLETPAPIRKETDSIDRAAFLELLRKERTRLHGKVLAIPEAQTLFNALGRIEKHYAFSLPF